MADLANADSNTGDSTGSAVAISSFGAVAGAPAHDGAGRAYLFPTPPPWHPNIGLEAADTTTGDNFGAALSMSGTTVLAGAPAHGGMGSAYVFAQTLNAPYTQAAVRAGGNNYVYERPAELKGSDSASGDQFGASVSIDGTLAVVGAPGHGGKGSAYLFTRDGQHLVAACRTGGRRHRRGRQFRRLGVDLGNHRGCRSAGPRRARQRVRVR